MNSLRALLGFKMLASTLFGLGLVFRENLFGTTENLRGTLSTELSSKFL